MSTGKLDQGASPQHSSLRERARWTFLWQDGTSDRAPGAAKGVNKLGDMPAVAPMTSVAQTGTSVPQGD